MPTFTARQLRFTFLLLVTLAPSALFGQVPSKLLQPSTVWYWAPAPPLPLARYGLSAVALNDKLYALGGWADGVTGQVDLLRLRTPLTYISAGSRLTEVQAVLRGVHEAVDHRADVVRVSVGRAQPVVVAARANRSHRP